jgi:hypothetical protein
MQDLQGSNKRTKFLIMGVKGEAIETKGINNLFNSIIAENIPFSRKGGASRYRRLSEHQIGIIRKETLNIKNKKY